MYLGEVSPETRLPGFDALHSDDRLVLETPEIDEALCVGTAHRALLHNDAYAHYLRMHKVLVNRSGSDLLRRIGSTLEEEDHPEYLESAGWAFAEAAIANSHESEMARLDLLQKADESWQRAIKMYDGLELTEHAERWRDDSKPFRLALNLAYTPIMRAIVCGDVTDETRRKVTNDTLAIAQLAELHRYLAENQENERACCELYGFMHECNIMIALLLLDNPAYVPIPSSSRADSGIYNPRQTHDISLINQSYGTIKKVIPIEAKKERRIYSVKRYDAMLITRSDLTANPDEGTIEDTLHMLAHIFERTASWEERQEFGQTRRTLRARLRKYQQYDPTPEHCFDTRTQFRGTRIDRKIAHRALMAAEMAQRAS